MLSSKQERARRHLLSCSALRPRSSCARRASGLVAVEVRWRGEGWGGEWRSGRGGRGQERAAEHERQRGRTVAHASALRFRSFEGAGRHGEANGGRGECKGSGGGRARHVGVVSLHSPRDEPPGSSLLCSEGAGKDEVVGRPRRASRTGQERAAGQEGRRGRTVARAPALRFRPACVRRASELVLVEFQGHGNDWEQAAEAEYALDVLQWVSTQAKRRRRK